MIKTWQMAWPPSKNQSLHRQRRPVVILVPHRFIAVVDWPEIFKEVDAIKDEAGDVTSYTKWVG
jgi:hypothetical protein